MRRIRSLTITLILLALLAGPVLAATLVNDDFAGSSPGWTVSLGVGGSNHVNFNASGALQLRANDEVDFPMVGRTVTGVTPYWRYQVRFRYTEVALFGTSLAVGSAPFSTARVPWGVDSPGREDILSIHQVHNAVNQVFHVEGFDTIHYTYDTNLGVDLNWHTVELEVSGSTYVLRLDGTVIGTGAATRLPQSLYFGNPFTMPWTASWTDFVVDWVRLESDQDPPVTTASLAGTLGGGGWYRSAVAVTLSATDAWSGVANTQYQIDGGAWQTYSGPFTVAGNGYHTLNYRSTDRAGNAETASSVVVPIDMVPPIITVFNLAGTVGYGGWYISPLVVTLAASDAGSGLALMEYRIDGGAWTTYTGPFNVVSEGAHTIECRPTDVAGNSTTGSQFAQVDTTLPTTSATPACLLPGNGGWCRQGPVAVTLSATDAGSGVSLIQYRLAALWQTYSAPVAINNEGSTTLYYRAADVAGNVESQQSLVQLLDTVAPASILTGLTAGQWVRGTVPLNGTASDATSGVAAVAYTTNGGTTWNAAGGTTTWSATWDTTAGSERAHQVGSRATDVAGNVQTPALLTVNVDNTPPTTTATPVGTLGGGWYRSAVNVTLAATDAGSGVATVQYRVDGGAWTNYAGAFNVASEGNHAVEYRATDMLGNQAAQTLTLRIDTTPPATTATPAGTLGSGGWWRSAVAVTLSASDARSGVSNTQYRVDGGAWSTYSAPVTVSSDGTHTVEYRSTDVAGNVETAGTLTLRLDTTPPALTTTPAGTLGSGGWYRSAVAVTVTAGDTGSGLDSTEYRLDGGAWTPYTAPVAISSDGTHTLEARATDVAGNLTTSTRTIRIDGAPPVTTATPACTLAGNAGWCRGPINVSLTASDATAGVDSTEYRLDGGTWSAYTGPVNVTGDGTHTVDYRSTDVAGNIEPPGGSLTLRIDSTPPTVTTTPAGTAGTGGWYRSAVAVTVTAGDTGSGLDSTEYRVDGGAWTPYSGAFNVTGDGTHTVAARATDVAGNSSTTTRTVRVDTVPPATTATPACAMPGAAGWCRSVVSVSLAASDATAGVDSTEYRIDGGAWTPYSAAFTVVGNGSHTVAYRSTDVAGNVESAGSLAVQIDALPPVLTATPTGTAGTGGWYRSAVSLAVSGVDAHSGLAALDYQLNGGAWTAYATPLTLNEGVSTVGYRGRDVAGNGVTNTLTVRVDTTPPATTATPACTLAGTNGWCRGVVNVSLAASDATAGVDTTEYRLDGGTWSTYSGPVAVTGDGTHTLSYRSTDAAGNGETAGSLTVRLDTTPPVVTATPAGTPGQGSWWRSVVTVTLAASDATAGVDTTEYRLDGGTWSTYSGPLTVTGDGSHTLSYRATDRAGNQRPAATLPLALDTTPPATTATLAGTPGDQSWYRSPMTVTLNATDATAGVAVTRYQVDGGPWLTYTLPFSVSPDGVHTVAYGTTDLAGNVETTHNLPVRVDTTPPDSTLTPTGTPGQAGWWRSPVTVTVTATDTTAGVAGIRCQVDGGTWLTYTAPLRLAEGQHQVACAARDVAGNPETPETLTVWVDTTPPTITPAVSGLPAPSGWYTTPVTVSFAITDAGSGPDWLLIGRWPYTGPVTVTDGTTPFPYTGSDQAGNPTAPLTLTVRVDTQPPTARIVGGTFCAEGGELLLLRPTATDAASGLRAWRVEVANGRGLTRTWTGGISLPGSLPWNGRADSGPLFPLGTYPVRLWVQDQAGWTATAVDQAVLVSAPPPPDSPGQPAATRTPLPTATATVTPVATLRPPARGTPTPTPTAQPTPRATTSATPATPPPTLPPPATPVPLEPASPPAVPVLAVPVQVCADGDANAECAPAERGLAGLRVQVLGPNGPREHLTDATGVVTITVPQVGDYTVQLRNRPGLGWRATTRTELTLRYSADGSLVVLPAESAAEPLPLGLAPGMLVAVGLQPPAGTGGWALVLGGLGFALVTGLSAVLDRRAQALRALAQAWEAERV